MKLVRPGPLLLAMLSARALAAQIPLHLPSDSARLQGTWTMLSGSADGVALPPANVRGMKRVLVGDSLTVTMGGQLFFSAFIELASGQSPKAIDYHMTGGPTDGAIQRGIYIFSGDTVLFCFASPGAPRPSDCATSAGDGKTISTWVRRTDGGSRR